MNMARYRQRPGQASFDRASFNRASFSQTGFNNDIRQVFDRLQDGNLFGQGDSDDSSVVTSQWVPRVGVKEERDRFVLYADLPGIDPADIEVSMAGHPQHQGRAQQRDLGRDRSLRPDRAPLRQLPSPLRIAR